MENALVIENTKSYFASNDFKLRKQLWTLLRVRAKNYWHSTAYIKKLWDGYVDFFDRKTGHFLTGLMPEVKTALDYWKIPYRIYDQRKPLTWARPAIDKDFLKTFRPKDDITLEDYQVDLVNAAILYGRGLVTAPTACHRKGQYILMWDGSLKKVEDILEMFSNYAVVEIICSASVHKKANHSL